MATLYNNFIKTSDGYRVTSSNTPLDGRSVVNLDSDIRMIPFAYIGQIVYSLESEKFFVIKSLRTGWEELSTGTFFDYDPGRPISEVRRRNNGLPDRYEEFANGSGLSNDIEMAEIVSDDTEIGNGVYLIVPDDKDPLNNSIEIKLSSVMERFPSLEGTSIDKKIKITINKVNLSEIVKRIEILEENYNTIKSNKEAIDILISDSEIEGSIANSIKKAIEWQSF